MFRTGDRFTAYNKANPEGIRYEFVGLNPYDDTGSNYIVLQNIDTGNYMEVDRDWFLHRHIVKIRW